MSKVLGVSKAKAQRLIERFITLGILEVKTKGNSRNAKTIYKYTDISIVNDIDKVESLNTQKQMNDTVNGTDIDKMLDLYQEHFELLTSVAKQEIRSCCKDIELELFRYLIHQIKKDNTIRFKDRYLIRTLKDLYSNNVKNVEEFVKYTDNYKAKKQTKKNWNYTEVEEDEVDFNLLAELTRLR